MCPLCWLVFKPHLLIWIAISAALIVLIIASSWNTTTSVHNKWANHLSGVTEPFFCFLKGAVILPSWPVVSLENYESLLFVFSSVFVQPSWRQLCPDPTLCHCSVVFAFQKISAGFLDGTGQKHSYFGVKSNIFWLCPVFSNSKATAGLVTPQRASSSVRQKRGGETEAFIWTNKVLHSPPAM